MDLLNAEQDGVTLTSKPIIKNGWITLIYLT